MNLAASIVTQMIELFDEYAESLGLDNGDIAHQERACEFEDKFRELVCRYRGHKIIQDQCGKPEHDFCYYCQQLKSDIE